MQRAEVIRQRLRDLLRAVPFKPFALSLENGDRVILDHPENIAFVFEENGYEEVVVLSAKVRLFTTLAAVSSVALIDHGDLSTAIKFAG